MEVLSECLEVGGAVSEELVDVVVISFERHWSF